MYLTTRSVIAVTGLAGHAFGSWVHRESSAMWLKDFLPQDFPNVRVLTYGYDTNLSRPRNQTSYSMLDHRRDLTEQIENVRRGQEVGQLIKKHVG